ncbi:MAG: 2-oxoglutarate dehydrogenase E1 component [Burkholderiales bacterium]|nr:2-oxoglutarate dehydrogenase E1 component [Burkholderiales bacterium]
MSKRLPNILPLPEAVTHSDPFLDGNHSGLVDRYRKYGYIFSNVNPLVEGEGGLPTGYDPEVFASAVARHAVPLSEGPTEERLRTLLHQAYCGDIGVNADHVRAKSQRVWLYGRLEGRFEVPPIEAQQLALYRSVLAAERFEQRLAELFPGEKRFSLEGCESMIPFLQIAIDQALARGLNKLVIGMPHRGRLNAICNVFGVAFSRVCSLFGGHHNYARELASSDIKEHLGLQATFTAGGAKLEAILAHNPSHLESVTPVIPGMVRSLQDAVADGNRVVMPLVMHGDASFTGQGIVAEAFTLSRTRGYSVGGTVHLIINNQIGSTISHLADARSTLSTADLARAYDVPIIHVNGDSPEAVAFAAKLAVDFRQTFRSDIVIDLIGYRRHGHFGQDDPTVTQPAMQRTICSKPSVAQAYRASLLERQRIAQTQLLAIEKDVEAALDTAPSENTREIRHPQSAIGLCSSGEMNVRTNVPFANLQDYVTSLTRIPHEFSPHTDVVKLTQSWRSSAQGSVHRVDWCLAETLAYATLLVERFNVRLTGLDVGRGSFFHRYCVWDHQEATCDGEEVFIPLRHLTPTQGAYSVFNTPLSEEAVVGYEYGYSLMSSDSLVVWEAQFGDFVNNAQVIIDQFISSAEIKWGYKSGLVMLLPHGYEGGGAEHSSAYVGRFLALCADNNLIVAMPSTSAQMFHLLRRHKVGRINKPLVVFTPKVQLYKNISSHSSWNEFTDQSYRQVLDDDRAIVKPRVKKVVLCSGKVFFDLSKEDRFQATKDVALVRIEQLYPFPGEELKRCLLQYPEARDVVWLQEEPRNHGAWTCVREWIEGAICPPVKLSCVARSPASTSAGCERSVHLQEIQQLVDAVLLV